MIDIKAYFKNKYANVLRCHLCVGSSETFSYSYILYMSISHVVSKGFTLESLNKPTLVYTLKKSGKFLERYLEDRKLLMKAGKVVLRWPDGGGELRVWGLWAAGSRFTEAFILSRVRPSHIEDGKQNRTEQNRTERSLLCARLCGYKMILLSFC